MKRPVIGIAGVFDNAPASSPFHAWKRIITSQAYVSAVTKAGGIPVMLPVLENPNDCLDQLAVVDGLLLQGGNDIDPELYGQTKSPLCQMTNRQEDLSLIKLVQSAREMGKPVFGICKGIQVINVAFGGTLFQDYSLFSSECLQHRHFEDATHPCHDVRVLTDSRLWNIFKKDTLAVNSLHHQILQRIGTGLTVTAYATDGVPEAVEATEGPFLMAVQWHPEALLMADNAMLPLLQAFVSA